MFLALLCLPNPTSVEVKETPVQCVTCSHTVVPWNLRGRDRREKTYIYLPVPLPYFVFPRVFVLCLCISSFPTPPSSERWSGCAFILEQCLQQSRCPGKCPVRSGCLPFVPNEALSVRWQPGRIASLPLLSPWRDTGLTVLCARDLMWRRGCGKVFVRTGQGFLAQKAGNCG